MSIRGLLGLAAAVGLGAATGALGARALRKDGSRSSAAASGARVRFDSVRSAIRRAIEEGRRAMQETEIELREQVSSGEE